MTNRQYKYSALIVMITMVLVVVFQIEPFPQDPAYHLFADERSFFAIPNTLNVISNLVFILVGIAGLYLTIYGRSGAIDSLLIYNYLSFFLGIALIGIASGYYHHAPNNTSLFVDRLAISFAFMALLSIIIAEYVFIKYAFELMIVLIIIALASVIYWYQTELEGAGDLRWYAVVQFLPLILIAMILLLFSSKYRDQKYIWLMLACYGLAKVFEVYDVYIYQTTGLISGHTLKHLIAGTAPAIYIYGIIHRKIAR